MVSLNLDLARGLLLSGVIALILTLMTFLRRRARGDFMRTTIPLTLLGYLHFLVTVASLMYPVIFSSRYDLWFLIYSVLMMIHWMLLGDCILSYIEKKILDPQYHMGENGLKHPYSDDMFSSQATQNMYHYVERMLGIIVFTFVFFRYATNTLPQRYHGPVLFMSLLLLMNGLYANTDILAGKKTTLA